MRNATAPGNSSPTLNQTYSPSVPISLYREVVAELQAAQAMLDSLNAQNQQLGKQNQQLRLEIETVVQSAVHLQQVVDSFQPINQTFTPTARPAHPELGLEPNPVTVAPPTLPNARAAVAPPSTSIAPPIAFDSPFDAPDLTGGSIHSEQLFTEQQEPRYRRASRPTRASDMGGVWLVITILLIVVSAFGAGYWVVRPILMKR